LRQPRRRTSGAEANSANRGAFFHRCFERAGPALIEEVTDDLGATPGLAEKEWHVFRALAVIPY
jgi:hypothetical protein